MRDEHQEALGASIARLREQQGWSQRALAKWVGLDQSAVSRIEAGRRRLSAEELQRFADALHASADELLQGAAGPSGAGPTPAGLRPARGRAPFDVSSFSRDEIREMTTAQMDEEAASAPALEVKRDLPGDAEAANARRRVFSFAPSAPAAPMPARDLVAPLRLDSSVDSFGLPFEITGRTAVRHDLPRVPGLPDEVAAVAHDWFALRRLAQAPGPAQRWSTGHSAEGKPERIAHTSASLRPGAPAGDVLYDRVARFWRSELHVEPDDGPLPDLIPLLEDGYGVQVIVARVGRPAAPRTGKASSEHPVAASFSVDGVPFIFVNAARPVVLQRFALAHAFAHHVLGHGDVVDHQIEWSRNVPPEAAANDFTEEFLAPVRAVQRWYERREMPRLVGVEDLLQLANAFGISAWSALFRSRAAGRLHGKQFHVLRSELKRDEWALLPRQAFLGGLRDTLSHLTPDEALPRGESGGPAVLRVPAPMRAWALPVVREGRLSLEETASLLRTGQTALARQFERLGLE